MNQPGTGSLGQFAPGLAMLRAYQPAWIVPDLVAGLSVAAVALPTAVAYAQLAGFPPVVGLYASILPLVALSMLVLLIRSSRPADAVLGHIDGVPGFHNIAAHEGAVTIPGLVLYRFNAPVIFYNAAYFKRRVLAAVAGSPGVKWLVVDGAPIVNLDSTGADTIAALADELAATGVRLVISGTHTRVMGMLERSGAVQHLAADSLYSTLVTAVEAYQEKVK